MTRRTANFSNILLKSSPFPIISAWQEAGEEGEWMAPAEILKILHQEVDIPLNAKRVAAFGRILRKQGIPSRHTRKGTVYQLVRA